MSGVEEEDGSVECSFCGAENSDVYSDCRNCGRTLSLEDESTREEKQSVLERLEELEEEGVLEKLQKLDELD
mgnify:FL=1